MRIGINGSGLLRQPSLDVVADHAKQAADDGFPSYWVAQVGGIDALTALVVAGREAPGIELGTAVIPTWLRHPLALGVQALSTHTATGGRLVLGIGLSHQPVVEGFWGIPFERPVRHLREHLAVLAPLLHAGKVSVQGELLSGTMDVPLPDLPPPPILVAALGPQMLRLAGRDADGTILWMVGPTTIRDHIAPTITAAATEAGRPSPRIVAGLPVCVTDDVDATRERAARGFEIYGQLPSYRAMLDREGVAGPADVALIGDEEAVGARLDEIADAGATDFAAVEFGAGPEERDRTRALLRSRL